MPIYNEVLKLANKPIEAVATHIHWDHIGGHQYFPEFYAHSEELDWLDGKFPLTIETIKEMVVDRCDLPDSFSVNDYVFFQGKPTKVLKDHDVIDIGSREIEVLHTPGHSPGHLCFCKKIKDICLPVIWFIKMFCLLIIHLLTRKLIFLHWKKLRHCL